MLKFILVAVVLAVVVIHFWPDISPLLSPAVVQKATPYIHDGKQLINKAKGL
jgi:hypothetical protein